MQMRSSKETAKVAVTVMEPYCTVCLVDPLLNSVNKLPFGSAEELEITASCFPIVDEFVVDVGVTSSRRVKWLSLIGV